MRGRRRGSALLCACLLLPGCSSGSDGAPSAVRSARPPAPPPAPSSKPVPLPVYAQRVLAARPLGYWPLTDVPAAMVLGDESIDLTSTAGPAVNADGRVDRTEGPMLDGQTTSAASFRASGRLVTGLEQGLSSSRPFTLELWFRADGCTGSWGRIAGTEVADAGGREGFNLFHYPVSASQACRVGAEVWEGGRYVVGCPGGAPAPTGKWQHFAVTWDGRQMRCFAGGEPYGRQSRTNAQFAQRGPLGIGSTGTGNGGQLGAGSIAQVAAYDRALPAEVLRSRARSLGGVNSGPDPAEATS